MAGGYKQFGPTFKSTGFVRLGYEGILNGTHKIDIASAQAENGELAGKMCTVSATGVKVASAGGVDAVGLFREDLNDMINASENATFYFRGGEYYVQEKRLGLAFSNYALGQQLTTDAHGRLIPVTAPATEKSVAIVTHTGAYKAGNMYEWAGTDANGGNFVGFIMLV